MSLYFQISNSGWNPWVCGHYEEIGTVSRLILQPWVKISMQTDNSAILQIWKILQIDLLSSIHESLGGQTSTIFYQGMLLWQSDRICWNFDILGLESKFYSPRIFKSILYQKLGKFLLQTKVNENQNYSLK